MLYSVCNIKYVTYTVHDRDVSHFLFGKRNKWENIRFLGKCTILDLFRTAKLWEYFRFPLFYSLANVAFQIDRRNQIRNQSIIIIATPFVLFFSIFHLL